jgi:outer membrane beta-barrel protein
MRRHGSRAGIIVVATTLAWALGPGARAQDKEPTPPGSEEPSAPGSEPTPPGSEPTPPGAEPTPPGEGEPQVEPAKKGALGSLSWRDIKVVQRRPILKYHRLEIIPTYNVTLNSPVVRHHGFGGIFNFFLSETLNIALEATYYQNENLEHYFLRGLNDRVLPSANRYWWSAAINFGYVPIYGKFAIFNRWIVQWEAYIGAGLGVLQTEWLPRDPANLPATNFDVMWHIDFGLRTFLTKWLVVQVYLKDYMFVDKFEPTNRPAGSIEVPPADTHVSQFVNNVVFGVGIGMFLPTSFEYKYTR